MIEAILYFIHSEIHSARVLSVAGAKRSDKKVDES